MQKIYRHHRSFFSIVKYWDILSYIWYSSVSPPRQSVTQRLFIVGAGHELKLSCAVGTKIPWPHVHSPKKEAPLAAVNELDPTETGENLKRWFHKAKTVVDGCNESSFVFLYIVFESLYLCVNAVFNAGKSSSSLFSWNISSVNVVSGM